jgi:hypothetical protein
VVLEADKGDPDHYRLFKHGATVHGLQFVEAQRSGQPTTYYTPYGGVGRTINFLRNIKQAPPVDKDSSLQELTTSKPPENAPGQAKRLNIGAVGLGVGTLAAYAGPGDTINFYEINPAVVDIAENDKWFSFLADCRQRGAKCETKLGDARLTMENELHAGQPQHFDLLVLDAFSGDAIPVHLLTEEAFEKIYLPHLAADGTIAIHITNHYVDLEPVVRALAERFGFQTARVYHQRIPGQGIYRTDWMILSRNTALIAALQPYLSSPDKDGKPQPGIGDRSKSAILWTDDRSNLFDVLK